MKSQTHPFAAQGKAMECQRSQNKPRARLMRRVAAVLLFLAVGSGIAGTLAAAPNLEVSRVIVAEKMIRPGALQLVQVSLNNRDTETVKVSLHLDLRDEGDQRSGAPQTREVAVPPGEEKRFYFRFSAPESPGRYNVRMEVVSPHTKRNALLGEPVFHSGFEVGMRESPYLAAMSGAGEKTGRPRQVPTYRPPRNLTFERADLVWENPQISTNMLLVGEPIRIKASVRNVGGDIAKAVDVRVDYYNTNLPNRLHPISRTTVSILAPGEKEEMEKEFIFPANSVLGSYVVILTADSADMVVESDEKNNRFEFAEPIQLSHIKQIFPQRDFVFDEAGLFLFRWDSLRYNEYKVQVGVDKSFEDTEQFFDIPQGDKWLRDKEVVPLEGELPAMALGLLERAGAQTLYWRVMGRNSETDQTWVSPGLPFTIRLAPKKAEVQEPQPSTPPAGSIVPGLQGVPEALPADALPPELQENSEAPSEPGPQQPQ